MEISKEWIEQYNKNKNILKPVGDILGYFKGENINGRSLETIKLGKLNFPSGKVIARDPLSFLTKEDRPYYQEITPGEYDVEVAVMNEEKAYVALRVILNDNDIVSYEEGLIGLEDLSNLEAGEFFGFSVDSGLSMIGDIESYEELYNFIEKWEDENEDLEMNIFDNYLIDLFKENQIKHPKHQDEENIWLNFNIPGTDNHVIMLTSGYGEGTYPVYFAYDKDGKIGQVVVQFVPVEMLD